VPQGVHVDGGGQPGAADQLAEGARHVAGPERGTIRLLDHQVSRGVVARPDQQPPLGRRAAVAAQLPHRRAGSGTSRLPASLGRDGPRRRAARLPGRLRAWRGRPAGLVRRMVEFAIRDCAWEAARARVTPEPTDAAPLWALAWRTRAAAWMLATGPCSNTPSSDDRTRPGSDAGLRRRAVGLAGRRPLSLATRALAAPQEGERCRRCTRPSPRRGGTASMPVSRSVIAGHRGVKSFSTPSRPASGRPPAALGRPRVGERSTTREVSLDLEVPTL
jgi:hypothetical protein